MLFRVSQCIPVYHGFLSRLAANFMHESPWKRQSPKFFVGYLYTAWHKFSLQSSVKSHTLSDFKVRRHGASHRFSRVQRTTTLARKMERAGWKCSIKASLQMHCSHPPGKWKIFSSTRRGRNKVCFWSKFHGHGRPRPKSAKHCARSTYE